MSRLSTKLLCAVASAALLPAAPAAAQTVTRIVAFGDSYADDGNLFEITGTSHPAYPTGRFSGGSNFIDSMSQALDVPVDNFAIGGAFTGNGNINNPALPGFITQWNSYLAGGGPAFFPRVSGTFGPTDLVAVSIGGNDARAYQFGGGTVAGAPAAAAVSVAEATAGLNALVDAGAQNILFLAGDVGRLPEVAGNPIAAVGSAFATSFNAGMQASLSDIAAQGVIVNYLDLNLIADQVSANLATFGLTSAGACPIACASNPALQTQYLFYVDQLHLTSAGFAIVGQYAVRQLEAPLHFQAQTDMGLQTASAFGSTLLGRLDLSNARLGRPADGLNFYLTANTARQDVDSTLTNLPYDLNTFGITAGAEYEAAGTIFGAALNYSKGDAGIGGTGEAEVSGMNLGVYAGWSGGGGGFAEGYAGYGWQNYDFEREAVIDEIEGESDGNSLVAGAKVGYLFGTSGLRVGPVAGLSYAKIDIDGYTETGDPVLTLNVDDQDLKALVGSLGIEARGSYTGGGLAVQPYASLTAEKDFEGDGRIIHYANTASPTIVNSFVLPDRSEDMYGRLAGGVSIGITPNASIQINGSTTIERDGGDELSGFLGVKIGF